MQAHFPYGCSPRVQRTRRPGQKLSLLLAKRSFDTSSVDDPSRLRIYDEVVGVVVKI